MKAVSWKLEVGFGVQGGVQGTDTTSLAGLAGPEQPPA